MGQSLIETKGRIKSVTNTMKLTTAMKLVATAKLKSSQRLFKDSHFYIDELEETVKMVSEAIGTDYESNYLKPRPKAQGYLYLFIGSSLGLCGGYNFNLFKLASELINKTEDEILTIGTKGVNYFNSQGYRLSEEITDAFTGFDYATARSIATLILKKFIDGNFKGVKVISTKFINSLIFKPRVEQILPLQMGKSQKKTETILEPSPEVLIEELVPLYLRSFIYQRMLESLVSEVSSRRNAMDSASTNAQDIVDELQIEYNKERQGMITQEITEIVSGANGLA